MKHKAISLWALVSCLSVATWGQIPSWDQPQPMAGPWKDISEVSLPKRGGADPALPEKFRLLELDVEQMAATLARLPANFSKNPAEKPGLQIELPLPDGRFERFQIFSDPVMHPELAAKFPQINSFSGRSADGKSKVYLDFSPVGFHALIWTLAKNPVVIEPVQAGDDRHHLCYYQKDVGARFPEITCSVMGGTDFHQTATDRAQSAGDCQLRTFRLAIATSAEFTAASISMADPTGVPTTMANINAMVTAINGIFINEFAIQLQLIANNNLLIFTNAATDGYTDGNLNAMNSDAENQAVIDATIGQNNYDIGHAFGNNPAAGGSGASEHIGNVCVNGNKANAATLMNTPNPFGFRILVMHEMGHQFGANHTFNEGVAAICSNAGQLVPATAYEPGSGSTIMSYAGTCGAANVQGGRDLYFHTISLQEVGNYVTTGAGNCPTPVALANNAPTVVVSGAGPFTIPISTPFRLTGVGNDANGNALTFCWEQFDNQLITHPPVSTAPNGPVFRTFLPTASPIRYFPNLAAILNGTTPTWEVLPSVSRTMNFVVTVRDNAGGGGCTDEASVLVNVSNTSGPFSITSIGADPVCLLAEDNTLVTWNVANTTAPPVSCANVDIWLSLDGGQTFPVLLADDTPNDGSQQVFIPATAITTQGRIMVMGAGNIFLDINKNDIRIDCPLTRIVTDNPASGVHKARQRLETSGNVVVLAGTSARFYAGNEIYLKPGFWARSGSDFLARIKPCDPCVAGKPADLLAGKQNPKVYFYETAASDRTGENAGSPLKAFAFPNPFDQNFTISFELPAPGNVEIHLTDFTGRIVQTIFQSGALEAGLHQIPIVGTHLKAGVYNCLISTPDHSAQVKLVRIH